MPKFSIKTLGCKVNQYESQLIRENFLANGFIEVNGKEAADVYVINTCTVTNQADKDSRYFIRKAHNLNPQAKIVVTGCITERDADTISKIEGVTDIIRNCDKDKLLSSITDDLRLTTYDYITNFKDHNKAFVKIQDGCNNFCSYCKVPFVRGRSRSRPLDEIKNEVDTLLKNGFKEIVLSGICLGEWGRDLAGDLELADVIEELQNCDGDFRIRLSSIELKYISDKLLEKMAASKKMCRHLHIPLQSGDNHILKMMNRPYAKEAFLEGIKRIRSFIPEIGLTTDVLVGFPGETDRHFEETLKVVKRFKPHRIHVFSFSRREGTKAAELTGQVSSGIIKNRMEKLAKISEDISRDYRNGFLGKELEVLIEDKRDKATGFLTGYADNYIKVMLNEGDSLKRTLCGCKISEVAVEYTLATT